MICIYDQFATDFGGHGIGPLCPTSCEVTETLNGGYEVKMVHPIDNLGKWMRIETGRILRVPVPAAMTPRVHLISQAATDVYKTNGSRALRKDPSTSAKKLATYKKNKEIIKIAQPASGWYEVIGPDGKRGYMQTGHLTFVRTDYSLAEATGEVIESTQVRDQPFRIYKVVPELDKITVSARHLFYDLRDNMIKNYTPNKAQSGASVVAEISAACMTEHDFSFYSDIETVPDPEALEDDEAIEFINENPVDVLLGDDGFIDYYGGELMRDWFDVYLVNRVGADSGVEIREGKNMLGISYDEDDSDVITRIMPTGEDKDGNILYLPEEYIDSENIDAYAHPRWYHLTVSDCKENLKKTKDNPKKTKQDCYSQMREEAQKQFDAGCDLPKVTLKVDFVNCAETEEYRQLAYLQNIYLGDGVRVITSRLGISVMIRMTEYTFDCLKKRYTKMTLGTVEDGIEAQTISPRQIPAGSIKGSKLAIGSVGIGQLQEGSVGSLQIQDTAIGEAHIQQAAIKQTHIDEAAIVYAHIAEACIEALKSDSLEAVTAKIQSLRAGDIEADTLAAGLATFITLVAGTASFDAATIKHLVSSVLNLEDGVAGKIFIRNLMVDQAQMISATIGDLCIKASDGKYYVLDVDAETGGLTATERSVSAAEIASGQTEDKKVILETSMTVSDLSTSDFKATFAVINKIDATRIDVDTLLARQAFIDALYTSQIFGGRSIEMIVGDFDNLQIGGRNYLLGSRSLKCIERVAMGVYQTGSQLHVISGVTVSKSGGVLHIS